MSISTRAVRTPAQPPSSSKLSRESGCGSMIALRGAGGNVVDLGLDAAQPLHRLLVPPHLGFFLLIQSPGDEMHQIAQALDDPIEAFALGLHDVRQNLG